ncbi:MAG: cytochrome c biogenesis protein ResB, partial [Victivallales bacterium]
YNPNYTLFIPDKTKTEGYKKSGTFSTEKSTVIELGIWGSVPVSTLGDEKTGKWTDRFTLENGATLMRENAVPKDYEAKIRIVPKNGTEFTTLLKVNHPVSYEGWRIYLVSFGNDKRPYVQLSAKKDIGRETVIAGIWMLMIGTFISCFKRKERF